jgi:hypothetical protein
MRKKIGELLIESGAVNQEQVRKALGQQRAFGNGQRLGSVIITLGFASSSAVARALARQHDLPFVELPEISEQLRSIVSFDFQAEQRVVPFRLEREGRSERLHVAVDDPSDLTVVDELSFQLNKPIRVHVAAEDDLDRALGLVRGQVVDGIALGEDTGEVLELDRGAGMVSGSWHGEAGKSQPPPAGSDLFDWDLPAAPPLPLLDEDEDNDITLITPRSALKPKPPAPPAPPPLDDDDEDITLITPRAALKPKSSTVPPPPPPQESEEVLDELLGEPEPESPASASGSSKSVPVVVFGGAAKGVPLPPPPPNLENISEEDLKVLEDIERMADGAEATLHTEKVKPARMVASLIRLLIKKGVIYEEEFLEELSRK